MICSLVRVCRTTTQFFYEKKKPKTKKSTKRNDRKKKKKHIFRIPFCVSVPVCRGISRIFNSAFVRYFAYPTRSGDISLAPAISDSASRCALSLVGYRLRSRNITSTRRMYFLIPLQRLIPPLYHAILIGRIKDPLERWKFLLKKNSPSDCA